VAPCGNHTVVLVDADLDDVANLATFCSHSQLDYDIYLYKGSWHELEWLSWCCDRAQAVFIRQPSEVTVTGAVYYDALSVLKDYFTKTSVAQLT
jgi:hypothetical protein